VILSTDRTSFDRITDAVWLGSRIRSADDFHRLRAQGIRACVDMREEGAEPWSFDAYLWLPTVDHEPPSQVHLRMGVAFLRECERAGLPAFVHCAAGVGRSVTLVLAWLLAGSMRGGTTREALERIKAGRPATNPTAAQIRAAEQAAAGLEAP
jgi:atypical dual specificity phosphatase